jgi:hypothetical protein
MPLGKYTEADPTSRISGFLSKIQAFSAEAGQKAVKIREDGRCWNL